MNKRTRQFILPLFASASLAPALPVLAQDIVIDSGSDETVISRLTSAPVQQQPVCSDLSDGTIGNCARITVDAGGQVGIGNEFPAALLHVGSGAGPIGPLPQTELRIEGSGETFVEFLTPLGVPSAVVFRQIGGPSGGIAYNEITDALTLDTNGVARLLVDPAGNIGLNIANPSHPIHAGFDASNGNGAHLTAGGVWTNGSDRNSKMNFQPVDRQDVLARLVSMPITQWRYKGEDDDVYHVGPVAQDFSKAFGLGASNTHIGTVDADGISMVAIQALHEQLQEKQREIVALTDQVGDLSERLEQLEAMVGSR